MGRVHLVLSGDLAEYTVRFEDVNLTVWLIRFPSSAAAAVIVYVREMGSLRRRNKGSLKRIEKELADAARDTGSAATWTPSDDSFCSFEGKIQGPKVRGACPEEGAAVGFVTVVASRSRACR